MCHRSEASDEEVNDLTGLYEEGDLVKALVLKVCMMCCDMIRYDGTVLYLLTKYRIW